MNQELTRVRWVLVLLFVGIVLLTRIPELDQFVATDEARWFNRSANFFYALGQHEYSETYRNNSISVFTMWMNSLAFIIEFPEYRGAGQGYLEPHDEDWDAVFEAYGVDQKDVLFTGRLLSVLVLGAVLLLVFYYLQRIFGFQLAYIGAILIALDPFYLAVSRTVHLDAPMGTFLILSLIAAYVYFRRDGHALDLVISGTAAGMSVLGKLPGLLVIPGFLGVYLIFRQKDRFPPRRTLRDVFVWGGILTAVVFLLWPVMWVKPIETTKTILVNPLSYLPDGGDVIPPQAEPSDDSATRALLLKFAGDYLTNLRFYSRSFFWRTTPVVVLGLLFAGIGYWRKWPPFETDPHRHAVAGLLFIAVYFVFFMAVSPKLGEKYIISAYLPLNALAGMGLFAIARLVVLQFKGLKKYGGQTAVLLVLLLIQAGFVIDHFPYYFTYHNPLMGGSRRAGVSRFVGVGEGLAEAAEYLNQVSGAEDLLVYAWYGEGPFSYFFNGETRVIPTGVEWTRNFQANLLRADYLVVYNNQWYRDIPPELFDYLERIEPVHQVFIEEIEYVRVYRVADLADQVSR